MIHQLRIHEIFAAWRAFMGDQAWIAVKRQTTAQHVRLGGRHRGSDATPDGLLASDVGGNWGSGGHPILPDSLSGVFCVEFKSQIDAEPSRRTREQVLASS